MTVTSRVTVTLWATVRLIARVALCDFKGDNDSDFRMKVTVKETVTVTLTTIIERVPYRVMVRVNN